MSVVFILVFVAIVMAGGFLVAFIWAVRSGQYEDTYTPSVRILFDEPVKKEDRKTETGKESCGDQSQLTQNVVASTGMRVKPETRNPEPETI
jgi:cbb3-type cytochrome oxidase maturation protein